MTFFNLFSIKGRDKKKKRTGLKTELGGHLFEDRKNDYENYRFGPLNYLRDKIVSI